MKLCIAQYDIIWEDKPANMRRCRSFFEEASQLGGELIVFPEMSLTGFSMDDSLAEPSDGETCSFFCGLSRQYGIPCVFGYAERSGNRLYNRLAFTNGHDVVRYTKMHPFTIGGESRFTGGEEAVSFSLGEAVIGMTICYDLRFPELYRELSKTCGAVIVSASFPASRREHWLTLLRARAIEDQCYIIGCNRTGIGGGIEYSGDSAVFAPDGRLICSAGCEERLLVADIAFAAVRELRDSFPFINDRKNHIYRNFYE